MPVKMPGSPVRLMPDAHCVAAQNNWLIANIDLGDFLQPHELAGNFLNRAVVVAKDQVNLFTAYPLPVGQRGFGPAHAEVADKVDLIVCLHAFVERVEDSLVDFGCIGEGAIAITIMFK